MPDLAIGNTGWGGDLVLNATGDIATVDGTPLGTQRVTRRLLTPPLALLFHPDYGFGLAAQIGRNTSNPRLLGRARAQMAREAVVAQDPAPQLTISEDPPGSGKRILGIVYNDANSGAPMLVSFDVGVRPPVG